MKYESGNMRKKKGNVTLAENWGVNMNRGFPLMNANLHKLATHQ
jgi:hypothetical protein